MNTDTERLDFVIKSRANWHPYRTDIAYLYTDGKIPAPMEPGTGALVYWKTDFQTAELRGTDPRSVIDAAMAEAAEVGKAVP